MIGELIKENESAPVGSTIAVERAELERLRRDFQNVKRTAEQTRKDADRKIGELDKLLRRATDSKA
jgi:hypothetical protein